MHAPLAAAAGRTASPATARLINDRLALQLLQSEGPLTAGQLKNLTGLSRPTVADLVDRLQAAGLVAVVGESGAQRRGPNARLYGIVADRAHLLGLDLRTRTLTVAVADLLGRVRAERTVPVGEPAADRPAATPADATPADATAAALATALAAVDATLAEAGATAAHALAIGAPGLVDPVTGRLGGSAPTWHAALIGALRDRRTGTLLLENEVNLAALAEQRDGAARDRDTFVLLWLGHGTGAAVVLDGAVRRGASGGAGEIGFLPVPGTGGLPSATGCDGGFHSLAGSAAISRLAAEHGRPAPPPTARNAPTPRPPKPWSATRWPRATPLPASSTTWPPGSRSACRACARCSIPGASCSAARSAGPAARRSPSASPTTSPGSPRCAPTSGPARSAAGRCCVARCSPPGTPRRTTCSAPPAEPAGPGPGPVAPLARAGHRLTRRSGPPGTPRRCDGPPRARA
ncbi:transcriptional regulator [Streptomyces noursei]|uniref:Transcriptional regulator n=1 Tax=Streptomyces noursei TaxID=1971 RepID=A0A401QXA7_STRNR|nr:transcriptional regulator [Streptomyces noursei]